jgi:hypothetical protein
MGYYITMDIGGIVIPADKRNACLAAINALHAGGKRYSWVAALETTDLVAAFDNWRFHATEQDDGSVILEYFTGEKLGDDEILFEAIAPFVVPERNEGLIHIHGEESEQWRFLFRDGKIKREDPEVTWG